MYWCRAALSSPI